MAKADDNGRQSENCEDSIPTASTPSSGVGPGTQIDHFRVDHELGRGGAGVVYLAHDTRLGRKVAIKMLPPEVVNNPQALHRWKREARLLASLNHPNIAMVYEELQEVEGTSYLVLEYVEGETVRERIARERFAVEEAVSVALQIAEAISAAHDRGVVHRDLKPANIKITPEGRIKVLDFGVAKILGGRRGAPEGTIVTQPGQVIGTPGYMSPEQSLGKETDHRTDIWSFGCVLYEMLTAQRPFPGRDTSEVLEAMLSTDFDARGLLKNISPQLSQIIHKCLKKDPDDRYQSALELHLALQGCGIGKPIDSKAVLRYLRRPRNVVAILVIIMLLCSVVIWRTKSAAGVRWARVEAIPKIMNLIRQGEYFEAFSLAEEAERHIPNDPTVSQLWPEMSLNYSVNTDPNGASVFYRQYKDIDGPWRLLGRTPIKEVRFPPGFYAFKVVKEGYDTLEVGRLVNAFSKEVSYTLLEKESIPYEMVKVPDSSGRVPIVGFTPLTVVTLDSFLIDRFEVTNKEYKEFIDDGGYERREYWEHDFVKDGQRLSWEEAIKEFKDATGWPGPSSWTYGKYPKGQDDYPVCGVSWYEAAAYAKYVGKDLPAIYHWARAAMPVDTSPSIIPQSNFGTDGLIGVGAMYSLGYHGTYDMAGNVREWCYNATDGLENQRYVLGGAWGDIDYMFTLLAFAPCFDRSVKNGIRCMKYAEVSDQESLETLQSPYHYEQRKTQDMRPVSDEEFELIRAGRFSYDPSIPFDAEIHEYEDSSEYYRKERVTINAAYDGERMDILIFTPTDVNFARPYQAVISFPGYSSLLSRSSEPIKPSELHIKNGRASIMPVYKGMYERGPLPYTPTSFNDDVLFRWVKDWLRTIDYLKTRSDIDVERLAFEGGSMGGFMGSYISGPKNPRFRACILWLGGIPLWENLDPEHDSANYLPRITIPVLMINGQYDPVFPLETSAKPMFELLGTPANDKYHIVVPEGQHGGWSRKLDDEVIEFLDKYLGKPATHAKRD